MNILAMDLVKNKTVFCEYDSTTAEHKFGKNISSTDPSTRLRLGRDDND